MDFNFRSTSPHDGGRPVPASSTGATRCVTACAGLGALVPGQPRVKLIIGNHFESWNGGNAYARHRGAFIATVCVQKDVMRVSFRQLADWPDAQDPDDRQAAHPEGGRRPRPTGWKAFFPT